jgi:hypothetical protein
MTLLLNGAAGGWDELAIAVIALGVLWLAVKLAGRKKPDSDDDAAPDESGVEEEHQDPAHPPAQPPD